MHTSTMWQQHLQQVNHYAPSLSIARKAVSPLLSCHRNKINWSPSRSSVVEDVAVKSLLKIQRVTRLSMVKKKVNLKLIPEHVRPLDGFFGPILEVDEVAL